MVLVANVLGVWQYHRKYSQIHGRDIVTLRLPSRPFGLASYPSQLPNSGQLFAMTGSGLHESQLKGCENAPARAAIAHKKAYTIVYAATKGRHWSYDQWEGLKADALALAQKKRAQDRLPVAGASTCNHMQMKMKRNVMMMTMMMMVVMMTMVMMIMMMMMLMMVMMMLMMMSMMKMSCLVVSCLVLSCLVSSCLVLSRLVCLVLSCLVCCWCC